MSNKGNWAVLEIVQGRTTDRQTDRKMADMVGYHEPVIVEAMVAKWRPTQQQLDNGI